MNRKAFQNGCGIKQNESAQISIEKGWKAKKGWMILSGALFCILILIFSFLFIPSRVDVPSPVPAPITGSEPKTPSSLDPPHQVIQGEVKEGSSFSKSLTEKKIPVRWSDLIIAKLKPYVNFKKIRRGTYQFIMDSKGDLVKFIYEAGPTEVYEIEKESEGYAVQKKEIPLQGVLKKVVGEIRSSLFEAMDAAGEGDPLTTSFAEILASEIDFYKDVREGDRFKVVVEKMYKGDEFIRYGTIHAVEYQRGEKVIRGIRYQEDYYDEKGNSLRKAFLKVPLRFSRISSKFSRARNHPILGGVRPHYGVDYAAPSGTPIWAVADGTVVSCGWNTGFGRQVILRHGNGYVSCYGHLSGYGPGIRKGTRVKQKQVIGYVGSTGISTGPHLDYRLVKDGRFRNPLKETFPTGV
ncbi:MAG: M23 family metallopeptidase, partial [Desulfobacterales bacterium]|nr:M23 family metallopeptidase [Desulfobacterales bacterium]